MAKKKSMMQLNALLVKKEYQHDDIKKFIKRDVNIKEYPILKTLDITGSLFVKKTTENRPIWEYFVNSITEGEIDKLINRSNSAVLIVRINTATIAFVFGFGRHLLEEQYFAHDFGIKTALNTLQSNSIRSINTLTIDEQPIQRKAQLAKESTTSVFGIDEMRDILRSVTGSPQKDIEFKNINGSDFVYSFKTVIDINDIASLVGKLLKYYENNDYKKNFPWVDNIRKVTEINTTELLNSKLIVEFKSQNPDITISIPELIDFSMVTGFSLTNVKPKVSPTINSKDYLSMIDKNRVSLEMIKNHKLSLHYDTGEVLEYSIYKCIYYEIQSDEVNKLHILFDGCWYEIDNDFHKQINLFLAQIPISNLTFPEIFYWFEKNKKTGKEEKNLESEGDYNSRASQTNSYYLLDKKLIRSSNSSQIELCDLLTLNKQFIHVKHRKGGSSQLSHLFAQGNISAEILLGDQEFRKAASKELKRVNEKLKNIIPIHKFKSSEYEIVFLLLDTESDCLINKLPFFSKVNLRKTYQNLTQKGFKVSIAGVKSIEKM